VRVRVRVRVRVHVRVLHAKQRLLSEPSCALCDCACAFFETIPRAITFGTYPTSNKYNTVHR